MRGELMAREYRIISADSHLEIPVEQWVHRVPEQYREYAPKTVALPDGGVAQVVDGQVMAPETKRDLRKGTRLSAHSGSFETNDGAGPPKQRLEEQDIDGVDAEILFAGLKTAGLWRAIKDDNAYKAIVHAYNEWLADEYCSYEPDRLIGLGAIPESGTQDAIDEMDACARLGLKGVQLTALPAGNSYPTLEDDPFWAAAIDMDMPISVHVQLRGGRRDMGPFFKYEKEPDFPIPSSKMDPVRFISHVRDYGARGGGDGPRLIFAGVFDRFPTLQIYFAETQVGWIPLWLETLDDAYEEHIDAAQELYGLRSLDRPPSEYVREHCLWGFGKDSIGVRLRHDIGMDRIMWYSDFPHGVTSWPDSMRIIEKMFAGVPENEKYELLAGNCVRFYHLDEK